MSVRVVCDVCERPIPIEARWPEDFLQNGYTRDVNTRKLFPHLCKSCASKIDEAVSLAKDEWLKQIDISDRNSRINAARRELLGTKG